MPELPEMQALSERLDAAIGGSHLESVVPLHFSSLKTVSPAPDEIVGALVEGVGRRGKYLVLRLEGDRRVLIHLSQGGRIDLEEPPKTTKPRGCVVRFTCRRVDGSGVSVLVKEFGRDRKAGWWVLAAGEEGPLERLGPELGDEAFAALILEGEDKRRVHTILRDQRTVAGMGRGYTDDALFEAQLSPYAALASLDGETRKRLLEAISRTLAAGLEAERARSGGLPTKVGDHWVVHGRFGQPCPRCGEDLRRVSYESYEVTYCPACQTGGKILADRRLSRIVR